MKKIILSIILTVFIKAACGQVTNDTAWFDLGQTTTLYKIIEKPDTANVFILCSRKEGFFTYSVKGKVITSMYGFRVELFDNNWKSLTKDTSIIIWDYRKINHQ
jgi:hypothetical protein